MLFVRGPQAARLVARRSENTAFFAEGACRRGIPAPASAGGRATGIAAVAADADDRRELPRTASG